MLLLECGADPTFRNRDGQTAADCAAEAGLDEAAELILSKLE
jgi:ankyrin repeat protein